MHCLLTLHADPSVTAQSVPRTQPGHDYSAVDTRIGSDARETSARSGKRVEAPSVDARAESSPAAQSVSRTDPVGQHSAVDNRTSNNERKTSAQKPNGVHASSVDVGANAAPTQSVATTQAGGGYSAANKHTTDNAREAAVQTVNDVHASSAGAYAEASPSSQLVPHTQPGHDYSAVDTRTGTNARKTSAQSSGHVEAPSVDVRAEASPAAQSVTTKSAPRTDPGGQHSAADNRTSNNARKTSAQTSVHVEAPSVDVRAKSSPKAPSSTVATQPTAKYRIQVSARQWAPTMVAPHSSRAANRRYRVSLAPPRAESPKIRAALPALRPKVNRPVSPPPLRVSIGRVRFADAPAPPPQRVFKRPSPNYGLAAYLNGRGGGS